MTDAIQAAADTSATELDQLVQTVSPEERAEVLHVVDSAKDTIFTWDYGQSREPLVKLYEKAKTGQWNASTDVDWSIEVDVERDAATGVDPWAMQDLTGTPLEKFNEADHLRLAVASQNWLLSQFMHGEQGALICTSQIVETVPWIDAKYYAATQVMDEARHVEVFARYMEEKLGGIMPINLHLRALLDAIVTDSRWDMTYLGMQIMVEGLALAAFGFIRQVTQEPLLKDILKYVMSDEARHVAFGVLSLKEVYTDMSAAELRERQEFAYEAAMHMRNRFAMQEVWEELGLPVRDMCELVLANPMQAEFRKMLFSKIVPNLKKLGLLTGWLRDRFAELGVLQFEDWADTGEEYEVMQAAPSG
ncbi:MAG: ferritin-like domain-containing protein [Acidimicrobiia bacterium]